MVPSHFCSSTPVRETTWSQGGRGSRAVGNGGRGARWSRCPRSAHSRSPYAGALGASRLGTTLPPLLQSTRVVRVAYNQKRKRWGNLETEGKPRKGRLQAGLGEKEEPFRKRGGGRDIACLSARNIFIEMTIHYCSSFTLRRPVGSL